MGLDIIEVVMRCEETFHVELENSRLEQMRTVGDLYEIICEQLSPPLNGERTASPAAWTRAQIWTNLSELIVDQLQVPSEDVTYDANFGRDLRAD